MGIRLPFLLVILLSGACASRDEKQSFTATDGIAQVEGSHYATLAFNRGDSGLDELNKKELNELALKATRAGREIEAIRVLAWPDHEYQTEQKGPSKKDKELAENRAEVVKEYIKDELNAQEPIKTYNMARPPGPISRAFKSDEWTVKEAFKESGVTASRLPSGKVSFTKASKALVIIDYVDRQKH